MSVINVNELKARFSTRDRPTQKDYEDLIDTMLAGPGATAPTGPAGGDLEGTYPNPTVIEKSSDGDDALRPITADKIKNGEVQLKKLDLTGASTGDVPTRTLGGVAWQAPASSGGGSGTTPSVSGAIRSFTSAQQAMPAANGPIDVDLPADFGTAQPQQLRVTAVFLATFAGYSIGDEIDIENIRLLTDPNLPGIFVSSFVNAGVLRVELKVEYGDVNGAHTGMSIFHKTDATSPPIGATLIPFNAISDIQATFKLRVYVSRYEEGVGFGSIAAFQPVNQAIPAAASAVTFTHNFGILPSLRPKVTLICSSANINYAVGDMIAIDETFDVSGGNVVNPAFSVVSDATTIVVRREATTIKAPDKNSGALATLDATKWQIGCEAHRTVNVPTLLFPATQYEIANPGAVFGNGANLYYWHYDRHNTHSYLNQLNLTNAAVAQIADFNPSMWNISPTLFRFPNGAGPPLDYAVWCSNRGIYRMRLDTLSPVQLVAGDYSAWRPVDFDENSHPATPDMLLAIDQYGNADGTTHNHLAKKLTWTGSAYASANKDTLDWIALAPTMGGTFSIFTGWNTAGSYIIFFQYNPIKRRLYMLNTSSGILFIFKFDVLFVGSLITWWAASVPDASDINFEKAIVLPGTPGSPWANSAAEKFTIEYDLATGEEKSISFNRRGNTSLTGSICRVPWVE